jgi:hypothetical protein
MKGDNQCLIDVTVTPREDATDHTHRIQKPSMEKKSVWAIRRMNAINSGPPPTMLPAIPLALLKPLDGRCAGDETSETFRIRDSNPERWEWAVREPTLVSHHQSAMSFA